jgi:diguanylate cyclase (GGDEF)-like protein
MINYFFSAKHPDISAEKEKLLQQYLLKDNIQRGKIFVTIVIFFECILIALNLLLSYTSTRHVTNNFYLTMYIVLLSMSVLMLVYIKQYEKLAAPTTKQKLKLRRTLGQFIMFFLLWGALVALADQKEYGSVMAFAVNFMSVSIFFHASNKKILQLYSVPVALLAAGLPFFQSSEAILMGNYVNLTVFLFFCWLTSRMLYQSSKTNFYNKLLLIESNKNLAQTISEKEEMNRELKEANVRLKKLTTIDELTNIPNRRGLQQYIDNALHLSCGERMLSFIMIDIDAFKLFNDNYGHLEGDKVLQIVAQKINNCVESSDVHISRFGGEEFIIAVFDKSPQAVYELAECIRTSMEEMKIPHEFSSVADHVTVSIGIAAGMVENESQIEALKEKADFALYEAKSQGKNRIKVSEETIAAGTAQ